LEKVGGKGREKEDVGRKDGKRRKVKGRWEDSVPDEEDRNC
jgi:hypothetical protein